MPDIINNAIETTIESGILQSIIAFASWGYVIILLLAIAYYAFSCLLKLLFKKD